MSGPEQVLNPELVGLCRRTGPQPRRTSETARWSTWAPPSVPSRMVVCGADRSLPPRRSTGFNPTCANLPVAIAYSKWSCSTSHQPSRRATNERFPSIGPNSRNSSDSRETPPCRPARCTPLPHSILVTPTSTSRRRWVLRPKAIRELASLRQTCHMGQDGKTGETLLKSVLAPMFAHRHLEVLSWVGHNIFGNLDGKVLSDPTNKQSKVACKDRLLGQLTDESAADTGEHRVHRESGGLENGLGSRSFPWFPGNADETAVHLAGIRLGTGRAARLGLARFALRASRHGDRGLLKFLASFFKSPLGTKEQDFGPSIRCCWIGLST